MAAAQPPALPPLVPPSFPPSPPLIPPSSPEDSGGWTVIVGIFLGLTASVGMNLGNNLQALGLRRWEEQGGDRPFIWKIGAATFGIASLINFGAFGFAPAAILAPLESIQFVTNLIFGRFVNNAVITRRMVLGSLLIVIGCCIVVVFGPNQVAKFSVHELTQFWGDTWWILYLSFLSGFAGASQLVHLRFEAARRANNPYKHDAIILPWTFATSSAVVGSMCVVMSKCMSELVEIFVTEGTDVLAAPLFYISLVLTAIFFCGWIYRLNAALGKYDPLFIIPLLQSNYILFSISSGGVYFQEFGMLDFGGWVLFLIGASIMFSGLFLLAPKDFALPDDMVTSGGAPPPGKAPLSPVSVEGSSVIEASTAAAPATAAGVEYALELPVEYPVEYAVPYTGAHQHGDVVCSLPKQPDVPIVQVDAPVGSASMDKLERGEWGAGHVAASNGEAVNGTAADAANGDGDATVHALLPAVVAVPMPAPGPPPAEPEDEDDVTLAT